MDGVNGHIGTEEVGITRKAVGEVINGDPGSEGIDGGGPSGCIDGWRD